MARKSVGRIFKRSGIYWIDTQIEGVRYRESSGARTEHEARTYLERRIEGIQAQHAQSITIGKLIMELLDEYEVRGVSRLDAVRGHSKAVAESFGHMPCHAVKSTDITRYIKHRKELGRSTGTINQELGILNGVLKLAIAKGVNFNPPTIKRMPEYNARKGFFVSSEVDVLVKYLPPYLQGYVRFAWLSSWRKSEISSLTWDDVNLKEGYVRLPSEHSKNRHSRVLPLSHVLKNILLSQAELRVNQWVFHLRGKPIGSIRKSWASACRQAKLEGRLFHDLRRSAVRNMVRAGVPRSVAMKISGHRTESVFTRYDIVDMADLHSAMMRTENYLNGC